MELSKRQRLSNIIIDDPTQRYCEIYKITNLATEKCYVGQAVSHILNHKRYRPYGHEGRFRCHVSEAFSSKKNQCHYLNNAIKKYGVEDFVVELIECCELSDANDREIYYIQQFDSLFPNGYNLKNGGSVFTHTDESKKRVSSGVSKYYEKQKYERFENIKWLDDNNELYIKPLKRNDNQYGWYVYIERRKADFGGVHISLSESRKQAVEFLNNLRNKLATQSNCGNSLKQSLPLTQGNSCEELG
uniref:GIY-YIG domain-containing protein n=1 Tax=viral metagenome TaxID=1070528 RepID=A0A6C0D9A6_9ZZZZ